MLASHGILRRWGVWKGQEVGLRVNHKWDLEPGRGPSGPHRALFGTIGAW